MDGAHAARPSMAEKFCLQGATPETSNIKSKVTMRASSDPEPQALHWFSLNSSLLGSPDADADADADVELCIKNACHLPEQLS